MYETRDNTESLLESIDYRFAPEMPEPLEYWALEDFEDILPEQRTVS